MILLLAAFVFILAITQKSWLAWLGLNEQSAADKFKKAAGRRRAFRNLRSASTDCGNATCAEKGESAQASPSADK